MDDRDGLIKNQDDMSTDPDSPSQAIADQVADSPPDQTNSIQNDVAVNDVQGNNVRPTASERKGNCGKVIGGLYGVFLTVLGAVLAVAQVLTTEELKPYLEWFFTFLYGVGTLGIVYIFLSPIGRTEREDHHAGSVYLKIGAVVFGFGVATWSGINFAAAVEEINRSDHDNDSQDICFAVNSALQIIFTLCLIALLLSKSRICVEHHKLAANMIIMHMLSTCLCLWFRVLVEETVEDLHKTASKIASVESLELTKAKHNKRKKVVEMTQLIAAWSRMSNDTDNSPSDHSHLATIKDEMTPFLYPVIVEYSLIGAGLLYIMWRNIGRHGHSEAPHGDGENPANKPVQMSCDTSSSIVGFILGAVVFIGTIVVMIVFVTHWEGESTISKKNSLLLYQAYLIALYLACCMACIGMFVCLRKCTYDKLKSISLDRGLLIISITGMYAMAMFNLISGMLYDTKNGTGLFDQDDNEHHFHFTMTVAVLQVIQSSAQVACILDGLHRVKGESHKIGRQFTVFLMACNITLWMFSIFEVKYPQTDPLSQNLYQEVGWCIVSHISMPLVIFFRFHSAACFFDIWKEAWSK